MKIKEHETKRFFEELFFRPCRVKWAGSLVSCALQFHGRRDTKKPNVLVIVADDMDYSDPECYGGEVKSPNLSGRT